MISFSCDKCREGCEKKNDCQKSCLGCQERSYIKDSLGCDRPLETPAVWLEKEDEFYNCPVRFIMQNTYELLEKMDYYKAGLSSPPDHDKQSAKFLLGVRVFENHLRHFNEMRQGK